MVELNIQASLIRDAVILVKPQRVIDLLQEIDLEKERDVLIRFLDDNHTFHYASILSIVLRDYGQWSNPKIIQQRRSDIKWIMAILAKDFREIDIELYVASLRLDYVKAEELLKKGADPEVYFGGSTTAADFIHREIEHLTDELYPLISGHQECLYSSDAMQIVGLDAYEKMWQLFVRYKHINSTKRTSGQNYFLMDLCSVYQRYIDGVPDDFDNIDFTFDFPVVGWIDMHLYKNGNTFNWIELSDAYEPFEDMKEWIESIALGNTCGKMMTTSVCIENEKGNIVFSFQPLWTVPYGTSNAKTVSHSETGIFTIYDETENGIIFYAYCERTQLIEKFYGALLNYAKSMSKNKEFVDAWIWSAYNSKMGEYEDDSPEIQQLFLKNMQSPILDDIIKYPRL